MAEPSSSTLTMRLMNRYASIIARAGVMPPYASAASRLISRSVRAADVRGTHSRSSGSSIGAMLPAAISRAISIVGISLWKAASVGLGSRLNDGLSEALLRPRSTLNIHLRSEWIISTTDVPPLLAYRSRMWFRTLPRPVKPRDDAKSVSWHLPTIVASRRQARRTRRRSIHACIASSSSACGGSSDPSANSAAGSAFAFPFDAFDDVDGWPCSGCVIRLNDPSTGCGDTSDAARPFVPDGAPDVLRRQAQR
mmetsp:Transcript_11277/g.28564  ORF Transcript_11277/g.28564 Transcript_11277/m.28564 type:complete len:252 (-) Transcript_11277:2211-2966(-)